MRIASWNINSVRLRIAQVARYVDIAKPDVLCLQEIKCREGEFPRNAFQDMGLRHMHVVGQKGWHGVAIVSRFPIMRLPSPLLCPAEEARTAAVQVKGVTIQTLYVPAGGEEANAQVNPKFAHKLAFLERMKALYRGADSNLVLTGDLNIAPGEHDVWNHKQLLDVVSHTPVETEALQAILAGGGFVDLMRAIKPEPEKLYTWWSYRNQDWRASNRGRRLDHMWATKDLAPALKSMAVFEDARSWEKPSDHAPVIIDLK
jgi:exodeoxyribonuclease-3